MEKVKKGSKNRQKRDGFYEVMPGYADNRSLFSVENEVDDNEQVEVRQKMLRQLAALSGLLLLQLVLFAVLFQLTVNLG